MNEQTIIHNQRRFLALLQLHRVARELGLEWKNVFGGWPEWVNGAETGRIVAFEMADGSKVLLDRAYECPWLEESWQPGTGSGPKHPERHVYFFESPPCAAPPPAVAPEQAPPSAESGSSSEGQQPPSS